MQRSACGEAGPRDELLAEGDEDERCCGTWRRAAEVAGVLGRGADGGRSLRAVVRKPKSPPGSGGRGADAVGVSPGRRRAAGPGPPQMRQRIAVLLGISMVYASQRRWERRPELDMDPAWPEPGRVTIWDGSRRRARSRGGRMARVNDADSAGLRAEVDLRRAVGGRDKGGSRMTTPREGGGIQAGSGWRRWSICEVGDDADTAGAAMASTASMKAAYARVHALPPGRLAFSTRRPQ
jgi:hypothetical protein